MPNRGRAGAQLALNGTIVSTRHGVAVGSEGRIRANANGSPGGLDLSAGSTLTVADGGRVAIVFKSPPDRAGPEPYWGLRWKGNHLAQLAGLRAQGKLTFTVAKGVPGAANTWYHEATDCTYICVRDKWPPTVVARNVTVELLPGGTVTVHAKDIDAGSFHAGRK